MLRSVLAPSPAECQLPTPYCLSLTAFRLPASESSISALDTRPEYRSPQYWPCAERAVTPVGRGPKSVSRIRKIAAQSIIGQFVTPRSSTPIPRERPIPEFLYITRMPSARAVQNVPWTKREKFEPHSAALIRSSANWDSPAARDAFRAAIRDLWTTSQIGVNWVENHDSL